MADFPLRPLRKPTPPDLGLYLDAVRVAAEALIASGFYPHVYLVRGEVGGSATTARQALDRLVESGLLALPARGRSHVAAAPAAGQCPAAFRPEVERRIAEHARRTAEEEAVWREAGWDGLAAFEAKKPSAPPRRETRRGRGRRDGDPVRRRKYGAV